MALVTDRYKGLKKGYKAIFTLPDAQRLYLLLASSTLLAASLFPQARLPLIAIIAVTHTLPIIHRRLFIPRRVAALTIFTILVAAPLLWDGEALLTLYAASLIAMVVAATLASPKAAAPYALLAAAAALAAQSAPRIVAAAMLAVVTILLARIDARIRKAVGVSGIGFLNAFFHYILAGRKEDLENYLEKISKERILALHLYRFAAESRPVLDIVVSEIHPGPFRDIGSSTLPQALMRRSIPTAFLKAPATHSENLASSEAIGKILEALGNTHCPEDGKAAEAEITSTESSVIAATTLTCPGAPPIVLLEPQVPMEDLPRSMLEETGAVLVDAHSIIDKEYIVAVPGTMLYSEIITEIYSSLLGGGPLGELKAAAIHIEYSDGEEVAPGGITTALLKAGGSTLLLVNIDGNNMDPHFHSSLRRMLAGYADHIVITTTDTHVYSGSITRVEYRPVGTRNKKLADTICSAVKQLRENLEPVSVAYRPIPVKARYIDGEALEKISRETEKNLKDGVKIFATMALTPTLLAILDKLGYLLPVLVNHALNILHVAI